MDSYVIALPCGTQSVRFRLPLIMTIEEAGELLTRVKDAIQAMQIAV
jgi:4-aminobutyrate aminotransferase-like enzyme